MRTREIDEASAQQHGRQRILPFQGERCRIEQLVEIAVELIDAGIDDASRPIERGPIDQERQRRMNIALALHLGKRGVATEVYYPLPFHLQPCFRGLGYAAGAFPGAEAASREALALPIYPELSAEQQAYVVEQIAAFYAGGC